MAYKIETQANGIFLHVSQFLKLDELIELVARASVLADEISPESQGIALVTGGDFEPDFIFLRDFAPMAKDLRRKGKKFVIVTLSRGVSRLLKEKGLDSLMSCVPSIDEAFESKKNLKLDVEFVNPFIEGAINTFRIQCSTTLSPEKMYIKGKTSKIRTGIAGVIGLTSKGFNGSIAICYPKEMFLQLMERMLGEKYSEITSDLEDGAGELLNMIFGHAKTILNEQGHSVDKAIPTIVRGEQLEVRHLTHNTTLVIPFSSEIGPVHIEVSIQSN